MVLSEVVFFSLALLIDYNKRGGLCGWVEVEGGVWGG